MNALRAFLNAIPWLLGTDHDEPCIDRIKAERETARQAFRNAQDRHDSRDEHKASQDLIRTTSALLRAEMVR